MTPESTYGMPVAGTAQTLAFTGTAATSTAFSADIQAVRLVSTVDCWVRVGDNPTAIDTGVDMYIVAGIPETFRIGPRYKVSAVRISGGSSGSLYVTPLS